MFDAYGTFTYGTYQFQSSYRSKITANAVYAEGTNNLKYFQHTLRVEFILSHPDLIDATNQINALSTDGEMQDIWETLTRPRLDLSFTYQGAGYLVYINGSPNNSDDSPALQYDDIGGGPVPRIISWEAVGTNAAARVVWEVDFFLPRCLLSTNTVEFTEFEYERQFQISENGTTRITTSGVLEAAHRNATNTQDATNNAHYYYNNIPFFQTPLGFRRTSQTFDVAKIGRRYEFRFVDEEEPSPNAIYPYAIKVSGDHNLNSDRLGRGDVSQGKGLLSWTNSLNVSVDIAPGYPKIIAWRIFLWILYHRFGRIGTGRLVDPDVADNTASSDGENDDNRSRKPRNVLTYLDIRESLYSRKSTFRANWLGIYRIERLFASSGIFSKLYTTRDINGKYPWESGYNPNQVRDWTLWNTTVSNVVLGPTGYRGILDNPLRVIFDPCSTTPSVPANYDPGVPTEGYPAYVPSPGDDDADESGYLDSPSDVGEDYVTYDTEITLTEMSRVYPVGVQDYDTNVAGYKKSSKNDIDSLNGGTVDSFAVNGRISAGGNVYAGGSLYNRRAVEAVGGGSYYILNLSGYAVRHGRAIPMPVIHAVNGYPVSRTGTPLYQQRVLAAGTNPLYAAKWSIDYLVPFEITGNIFTSIDSKGNAVNHSLHETGAYHTNV